MVEKIQTRHSYKNKIQTHKYRQKFNKIIKKLIIIYKLKYKKKKKKNNKYIL